MERELWLQIVKALGRSTPTRPVGAVYTDQNVLAVALWAALHDRPISWACRRANWPSQAWRRPLPDQSTMSRRLRRPEIHARLKSLLRAIQRRWTESPGEVLAVDGKPLAISEHSRDPDASSGRAAGRVAKGYKAHVILEAQRGAVIDFEVHPMNASETTTATRMMRRRDAPVPRGSVLLGDAVFDSTALHEAARARGCQLIAPRKKPGAGLKRGRRDPNRLASVRLTEGADREIWRQILAPQRETIERFFGALTSFGAGLGGLPPWARRLNRVRVWIAAKLVINAARLSVRKANNA